MNISFLNKEYPDFYHGIGYATGTNFTQISAGANDMGGAVVSGSGTNQTYILVGTTCNTAGAGSSWSRVTAATAGSPPATAGVVDANVRTWLLSSECAIPCCENFQPLPEPLAMDDYRYGFQGQEKDDEIKGRGNSLDFGARMYDSRIGRFLSRDPMCKITHHYSPYIYAGNKPIAAIDAGGLVEVVVHYYHKSANGTIEERGTYKYKITTAEDIKGIYRSTIHVNVHTADVPVVVGNMTTFQYKIINWEIVSGSGETRMETLKRNNPIEYYAVNILGTLMMENPLGTGQLMMATQDRDPMTGEYRSSNQKTISLFQGIADMATLGIAGGKDGGLLKLLRWNIVDVSFEQGLSFISEKCGLNNDQKMIFGYHMIRFSISASKGDLNKLSEVMVQIFDKGIKGAEMVEHLKQKTGIDLNIPMNIEDAAKSDVNATQGK